MKVKNKKKLTSFNSIATSAGRLVPIWNEKMTHKIREFLNGFTNILKMAQDVPQTCSGPEAKSMIINVRGSSLEM